MPSCTRWESAEQGSSELIQMRLRLWSIACGELCYGSQWTCCWRSLRFSNKGSLGMCLKACSQSLGGPFWSFPLFLCLFLNMALKSTGGKANTEQDHIDQVRVQGDHRKVILCTKSLISDWGCPQRKCREWLMPVVHSGSYNRFRNLFYASFLTVSIYHMPCRDWDINIAAWWCIAGREDPND